VIKKVTVIKGIMPGNVSSSTGRIYTSMIGRRSLIVDYVVFEKDKFLASKIRRIGPRSPPTGLIPPTIVKNRRGSSAALHNVKSAMVNYSVKPSQYLDIVIRVKLVKMAMIHPD
jgi:hypothetical protein